MIVIGEFFLDKNNNVLYDFQHQEINVESQTMQVLLYLISHNDRYVSLSELHENLWNGRIVSDSAVRQTISKLRKLLNDTNDEPTIIRSVVKKGYRFIYPIELISPPITKINNKTISEQHNNNNSNVRKKRSVIKWTIATLFIAKIIWVISTLEISSSEEVALIEGINTGFSLNKKGDFIYINKSHDGNLYKLIQKSSTDSTTLLESKIALLFPLITTSQQLWVGWQSNNSCGLYQISKNGKVNHPITLLCDTLSHLSVQGDNLLLSLKPSAGKPFEIKKINTQSFVISPMLPSIKSYNPVMTAFSSDNRWQAVITQKALHHVLSIYDTTSNQLFKQWPLEQHVNQLRWHNNRIYVLTENTFNYIDMETLEKKSIAPIHFNISFKNVLDFWVSDENNFLLEEQESSNNHNYLTNYHILENQKLAYAKIFNLELGSLNISGNTPQNTYYSRKNDNEYQILQLTNNNVIYSSDKPLELLHYNKNEHTILFKEANILTLFDIKLGKVLSATNISEFPIIGGVFQHTQNSIYWLTTYSTLGWETLSWDYSTNVLKRVAVNELARFMVNDTQAWLDANDRRIKTLVDNTIVNLSEPISIFDNSQWYFSEGSLWFYKNIQNNAHLLKISSKNNWGVETMLTTDHIENIAIGEKNIYIKTKKNTPSSLLDIDIYSLE